MKPVKKNIRFRTELLSTYYSDNRRSWKDFYPSERWAFRRIFNGKGAPKRILDVGCATGGLAAALDKEFGFNEYVGVDIHDGNIEAAKKNDSFPWKEKCRFICHDILDIDLSSLGVFDCVVSLSCADWNVQSIDIMRACWNRVAPKGHFFITLRLTPMATITDMEKSFQYIWFDEDLPENREDLEKTPYVVFNYGEALALLAALKPKPSRIIAYGYWGKPSASAMTPYDRLVFTAIAVQKGESDESTSRLECHWPLDLMVTS